MTRGCWTFVVVTFFDTESLTDDSLMRDITQMGMQIATLSIDIVMKPIQQITAIGTDLATTFNRNRWRSLDVIM